MTTNKVIGYTIMGLLIAALGAGLALLVTIAYKMHTKQANEDEEN